MVYIMNVLVVKDNLVMHCLRQVFLLCNDNQNEVVIFR